MIDRDLWEDNVKYIRQKFLDKTKDVQFRRMVAAVIDSFSDELYDQLETTMMVKDMTEKIKIMGGNKNG
jgi:ATP-dependent protease HslVU (ClpYQ) peptidase subunit